MLQAHQRERVPATPPVDSSCNARTARAVKGSLRRAKQRRALDCCAPFWPEVVATGGSGGNTSRPCTRQKQKAGIPPAEESRPENKNKTRQTRRGLTGRSISEAARVSAVVRIVEVDGEPKLCISSHERGEPRRRLNAAVVEVLRNAGADYHYLGVLEAPKSNARRSEDRRHACLGRRFCPPDFWCRLQWGSIEDPRNGRV